MKKIVILLLLILLIPTVFAQSGSIKLLAVTESGNNSYRGSIVDLNLEIKPGTGRVFIDSFPLTKLDTQITTRTSNQIACDYVGDNCNKYDFFYTISSSAVIVGGPSAGAATTALTIAVLQNLEINKEVAVTGTINSGNIIGTVGGVKEKITAASQNGIKTVLIPFGDAIIKEDNKTISLIDYGADLNLTIVEVSTLDEVLEKLTGVRSKEPERNYSISEVYISTMYNVATELCNESTNVLAGILNKNYKNGKVLDNSSLQFEEEIYELTEKAKYAMINRSFYSAASYCYGAGLRTVQLGLMEQNISESSMKSMRKKLQKDIDEYEKEVDGWDIRTITDLEAYLVVKERIYESRKNIEDFNTQIEDNETKNAILSLATVISRLNSAKSWSNFYGKKGVEININEDLLMRSCMQKIAEAEERHQYIQLYFPDALNSIKSDIDEALVNYNSKNYAMCLFLATKAKADIDSIASSLGAQDLDLLINQRLKVAKDAIAEQNAKGTFPILGYSYYEYAHALKEENDTDTKATALIYTGYALELSKLDIYFKEPEKFRFTINTDNLDYVLIFVVGFVLGVIVYDFLMKRRKKLDLFKNKN